MKMLGAKAFWMGFWIFFFFLKTLDDENEDILVQIQEEQRQFPRSFARRLHQVGKGTFPYLMKPPGETSWKLSLFFLYLY